MCSQTCFHNLAWAFDDPAFADVLLVLQAGPSDSTACSRPLQSATAPYGFKQLLNAPAASSEGTAAASAGTAAAGPGLARQPPVPPQHQLHIHAHSVVLASCSEVLRCRLSRWGNLDHLQQQQQQQQQQQHYEKGANQASNVTDVNPPAASGTCGSGGGGLAPATGGNCGGSAAASAASAATAATCRPVRQLVMRVEGLLPPEAAADRGQGHVEGEGEGHGDEPGAGGGECGGYGDSTGLALRAAELLVRFMYDNQALERLGRTPSPPPSHHHTCSDGGGGGIGGSGPGSWRCEGAAAGGLAGGVSGAEDECLLLLNALLLADSWLFPAGAAACASRLLATPASALGVRTRAALLALPEGLYGGGGGGGGGAGGAAGGGVAPHLALLGQLVARTEAALLRTFRCPELAWSDRANRLLLLRLPAWRLGQLLARQDLQVTSENVMLLMVSHWLRQNHHATSGSSGSSGSSSDDAVSGICATGGGTTKGLLEAGGQEEAAEAEEPETRAGGGGGDGAPPSTAAQLLALVRYGGLTPHFRDAVAPCLPGLARIRLHHWLLAAAREAAAQAEAEVQAEAEAEAASAARCRLSECASMPLTRSQGGADELGAAAGGCGAADPSLAAEGAAAPCSSCTVQQEEDGPAHRCSQFSDEDGRRRGPDAEEQGQEDCWMAGEGGKGATGAGASGCDADAATQEQERQQGQGEQEGKRREGLRCGGGGGGGASAHGRCAAGARLSLERRSRTAPVSRRNSMGGSDDELWGAGGASPGLGGAGQGSSQRAAGDGDGGVGDGGKDAAGARAGAVMQLLVAPPRPVSSALCALRLEWARCLRDCRIHLTGIGGPTHSTTVYGPPSFLGGYTWRLATRFVPYGAATCHVPPGQQQPHAAVAPPDDRQGQDQGQGRGDGAGDTGGRDSAEGEATRAAAAAAAAAAGAYRGVAMQLGVWCCVERPGQQLQHGASGSSGVAAAGGAAVGAAGARGAPRGPVLARCSLGVTGASGRFVWEQAAAPCAMSPVGGGGRGPAGLAAGTKSGDGDGGVWEWEYWCGEAWDCKGQGVGGGGLGGGAAEWWERGSAVAPGGVLRLAGVLQLA